MSLDPENSPERPDIVPPPEEPPHPLATTMLATGETASVEPPPVPPVKPASPVDRYIANRERIDREFREVRSIVLFYGAILLPILIVLGWCYHRKIADTTTAELILGSIMYVTIAVFAWRWRDDLRGLFSWPRAAGRRIWLITTATPLLTLASITLARSALKEIGWPIESALIPEATRWPVIVFYLWIGVCPALFEEIAFRGLLLAKLKRLMTPIQAIWVTTLLFGIIHFDILAMAIFLIPLAWVAGWLTQRTRSLWPAMLIHFAHNAGVLTLELLT